MSVSSVTGPFLSTNGFQVGSEAVPVTTVDISNNLTVVNATISGNLSVAGTSNQGTAGAAGSRSTILKQLTGIVENTATDILTITVPNVSGGAGGRIEVISTITQTSHIGDSTRTIYYLWAVTRLAGAVAVLTVTVITGGSVIATKASGYTFTSLLAGSAVTGGATAVNTFTIQITNDASTDSTTTATVYAECINSLAGGTTIA